MIPELCRLTGVTEEMRTNFRLMRAVADYTRLDPKERIRKLGSFNSRLNRCHESFSIFKEWGFEMERNVVSVKGRVLSPEIIVFGNNTRFETIDADWVILFSLLFYSIPLFITILLFSPQTRYIKTSEMYKHVNLVHWALIYPKNSEGVIREFIGALITTAKGLYLSLF